VQFLIKVLEGTCCFRLISQIISYSYK